MSTPELRWENPKELKSALIEARETEKGEKDVERRGRKKISKRSKTEATPTEERERERERDGMTKVDPKKYG